MASAFCRSRTVSMLRLFRLTLRGWRATETPGGYGPRFGRVTLTSPRGRRYVATRVVQGGLELQPAEALDFHRLALSDP